MFYYTNTTERGFSSVEGLSREVEFGADLRGVHILFANMLLGVLYLHLFRGLFVGSRKRVSVWVAGWVVLVRFMVVVFLGYVLP